MSAAAGDDIDDSLYSRQRYVLGDAAMRSLAKSKVLLTGVGALGVEIAKNVILAGVKSLTVQDWRPCCKEDLAAQFYIRPEDVVAGSNRAEACLPRLAELNPYVTVETLTQKLDASSDLQYLTAFQCVVLTECPMDVQLRVDAFCRQQQPSIKFISADVFGVYACCFADLGADGFVVQDSDGEEPQRSLVATVTKANPGVVTVVENRRHGLETGDTVTFSEVKGMTQLNGTQVKVKVLNPTQVEIGNTSGVGEHAGGGVMLQVKVPRKLTFESLEVQCAKPDYLTTDFADMELPLNIHLGVLALHRFTQTSGHLPRLSNVEDADQLVKISQEMVGSLQVKPETINESVLRELSWTCVAPLAPLCAAMGGVAAQEVLKAVSDGKFTPLAQWLHLSAREVLPSMPAPPPGGEEAASRGAGLRAVLGPDLYGRLTNLKAFMVGCGAIGCEMLKNLALMGVATNGKLTITDDDVIEKSNLNRQFLFRPHHIRCPKSTTAAESTLEINPDMKIDAQQFRVNPENERVYTDAFFCDQDIIINALDNVAARRYVDSRCVSSRRALLESGTMGAKGHVQVVVPHLTESYSSQNDPVDEEVPFCTLKSFPASIEHCIQWARDKFASSFTLKPSGFNKFWQQAPSVSAVIEGLKQQQSIDGAVLAAKVTCLRPSSPQMCITVARVKFTKYFCNKAKLLLHNFPLDTLMSDGSLFWTSPKRPPVPLEFDVDDPLHRLFITSTARLYADMYGLVWSPQDFSEEAVRKAVPHVQPPAFVPRNKRIVTDETEKPEEASEPLGQDELQAAATALAAMAQKLPNRAVTQACQAADFEKDDDTNSHVDFITAAANLRARMYSLQESDRISVKRIAGNIVPAIATTTAAVAGLAAIELIKVVKQSPLEHYKNCFLNLALPQVIFSEPGPPPKNKITEDLSVSIWDSWDVKGNPAYTLAQFLAHFTDKYGLTATSVVQGVKAVYLPVMPTHRKRLNNTMVSLLKPAAGTTFVEVVVSLKDKTGQDVDGPIVRYYF